jgi:hypothetical protein
MHPNGKKKGYSSTELFQDFAVIFDWFHRVLPCVHSHGKHSYMLAVDVKSIVDQFVGRTLQDDAFLAACYERGLRMKNEAKQFSDLQIRVPDLTRVIEVLPRWNAYVQERIKQNGN